MRKKAIRNRFNRERKEMALHHNVTNYVLLQCIKILSGKMDELDVKMDYIKRILESRLL